MNTSPISLLAVEIGGSKLQLFAGDSTGEIFERRRFAVDRAAGGEGIRSQILQALPSLISAWNPKAIGVGYGGPLDWKTGQIAKSYHISGWSDFPLGEWLREQSGLPCFIENDANTAAFGEALLGAGKGFNPVFYITLGSGVGGGLVADGRLYHGARPGEMEIGHVRLERDGTIVETRCAGWSVDRAILLEVQQQPNTPFAKRVRADAPGSEARHLSPALAAGDDAAGRILRRCAGDLAFALSHVTHLAHPEVIVIGGGLALIGESLRLAVAEALPKFLMDTFQPGPQIALSHFLEDAVPVGALALAAAALEAR